MWVVWGKEHGFLQEIYIIFRVFTGVGPMKKTLLVLPGYCVGLGGLLLITYRTLLAVGSESKAITIQVNRFGEQYVDLAFLVFLWSVCMVGVVALSLLLKSEKVENGFVKKSDDGNVVEKQEMFFGVVPEVLLDEPLGVVDGAFGEPFNESEQRYFLLTDEGTGSIFSVSVNVLQDAPEE